MRLIWNYLLSITLCSYLFLEYYFAEDVKVGLQGILKKVCSYINFLPIAKLVALFLLDWIIISELVFHITLTKEWNNISYRQFAGRLSPFVSSNDASNKKFSGKLFSFLFPFPAGRHRYSTYGFEDWLHDVSSGQQLMKYERNRYETFKIYPIDGPSTPSKLAANGFYYTGSRHYVKCFCCGVRNDNWPDSETVSSTHRSISPHCLFANGNLSTNVPINEFRDNVTSGSSNLNVLPNLPRTYINRAPERPVEQQQTGTQETDNRALNISMRDDLNSFAARVILSKGYRESIVMDAIESFRKNNGNKPLTTDSIMDNIWGTEPNLVTTQTDDASIRRTIDALLHLNEGQQRTESRSDKKEQLETRQELERLKHEKLCKVCLDKDANTVFLPCGHLVACAECATSLRKCAVCRAIIKGTVRSYMA